MTALVLGAVLLPAPALAASCNWGGGSDFWTTVAKWSCGIVPGSTDDAVVTAPGSTVTLSGINANAATVNLGTGNGFVLDNTFLTIYNNAFTNNGTVTIRNGSQLRSASGTVAFTGTGTVVLDDTANYAQIGSTGGGFTFASGQTVRGSGNIGLNQAILSNAGLISANVATRSISLDAAGGNGGVAAGTGFGTGGIASMYNIGTLQAANGGTLSLEGGLYENGAGGLIQALAGSVVSLNNDVRVVGGTLSSTGTGVINAHGVVQYLNSVTLAPGSKLDVNNDFLYLNTALTNNGTITLANAAQLRSELAAVSIGGTGTIVLDDTANYAQIGSTGGTWTFGSGQTIRGSGQIGLNQAIITNNNVIAADVSGRTIDIDAAGGNGGTAGGVGGDGTAGLLNNGVIRATGGSIVTFEGGQYDNRPGTITATGGSTINLNNDVRIVGGTISADATSVINAHGVVQYLNSVTLASGSKLDVNNDFLYLNTALTNNGTITVANAAQLRSETAALSIGGTGTIIIDDTANYAQIGSTGGTWTFGAGQTIRGSGNIGLNQAIITNNNVIAADVSGRTIDIDAAGGNGGTAGGVGGDGTAGLLNNGVIRATGGSIVTFEGGQYDNRPGTITATGGSTINLNNDSRIVGGTIAADATSVINAHGVVQYLNSVTLASGSKLDVNSDFLYLNTALTNNGTVTVASASQLRSETAAVSIGGTGTIVLDNSTNYASIGATGGTWTFGSGQTISGAGQIALNQAVITNNGVVSANAGTGISIDAAGGNGGVGAGSGVGTNGNAGFYNTGTVQAANGSTLSLEGGLYENGLNGPNKGTFAAIGAGSTFVMNNDASLYNLQAGGVLNKGSYTSSTSGAASTLSLRSNAADSIVTIGTGAGGTDTIVTLSGANSALNVIGFSSGTVASIDSTLTNVAHSGELVLNNGRILTITAGGGALSNAGIVQLGGGTIGATSFANTGGVNGYGAVTVDIANASGASVQASGGTLATRAINGAGSLSIVGGATLDMTAATGNSTATGLIDAGNLALGTHNVTISSDYVNFAFGSGNAFNNHANVTGSGLILAASATQTLSGPGLSGNTLNVGNVRTGGSSSTTLTITNNGTTTNLIGAVQNTNAPSIALTGADFQAAHGGGTATVGISYTGLRAGSLAGQTIKVVNNFDNVASATLNLAGNVYQVAQAGTQPASVTLAARRVGDGAATANLTIANTAPVTPGFNEALLANASTAGGFTLNGGTSANATVGAGASSVVVLGHGTATAGAFSNTVAIGNTSQAVAGSGLADLALAGQSVAVSANVYATAVATVTPGTVNFGTVRQGAASPTGSVGVSNSASGALTDGLITTAGAQPAGITVIGTPGSLAAGASGNVGFALNTATAGTVTGTGVLNLASHDSELADVALASQSVSFSGTITQLAVAALFKSTGAGAFSGSGTSYTLDLGTLASGSGLYSDNLGISNTNGGFNYSELLGGSFAQGAGTGYTFTGASFANLAGGTSLTGDLLSFDTTGLSAGSYTKTVTLNGFSQYAGLGNLDLAPITLTISALVTGGGGVGGVPEPESWAMMLAGFGMIGIAARRRRTATPMVAA